MDTPFRGYGFADFRLELGRRRLTGLNGVAIPLSGRAYDVLVHLVEHRHRVVSKEELLEAVWPRTVVEDNNLNQAISAVRRALGDSREAPSFIVTVAGRGYQFVSDVVPLAEPAVEGSEPPVSQPAHVRPAVALPNSGPAADPRAEATGKTLGLGNPVSRRAVLAGVAATAVAVVGGAAWWNHARQRPRMPKSIAILPFKPLLPDTRNPPLELGVTELLTNRLSRLPGLVVLPLSSVMRFAAVDSDALEAGRQLGVDAVVEGHVYVQEDQVRLTARLVAVDGGVSLWANNYTERFGELLTVQDSLAMQLANALSSELSDDARSGVVAHETSDVEAWQQYANGRYQLDRRDAASLRRAAGFFEAALRRDPRFALASAGLSDAHALTAVWEIEPPVKAFSEARRAALRAKELDPRLPAAHVALGHVVTQHDRDLEGGRRHYLHALKLQPDFARAMGYLALNLTQAGDPATATDYIRKAQALEPASLPYRAISGYVRYFTLDYEKAEEELSRLVKDVPDAAMPRQFLSCVLLAKQRGAEVVRLLEGRNDPAPSSLSNLGRAYAQTGDIPAAGREIARLEAMGSQGYGVGFELGLIHTEIGDRPRALDALERGMNDFSIRQPYLNVEPALAPLRGEPRFRAISRKLGLG